MATYVYTFRGELRSLSVYWVPALPDSLWRYCPLLGARYTPITHTPHRACVEWLQRTCPSTYGTPVPHHAQPASHNFHNSPLPPSPHRCLYLRTGHPTTVHAHASYPHQVEHGSTTHVDRGCSIPLHAVFMLEDSTEGGISTSSAPPLSPTPSANTCIPYHTFVAVHALLFWTSSQNVGPY